MGNETSLAQRLNKQLNNTRAEIAGFQSETQEIEIRILELQEELSKKGEALSLAQVRLKAFESLEYPSTSNCGLQVIAHKTKKRTQTEFVEPPLGPLQRTVYQALPDKKSKAVSSSDLQLKLNSEGQSIKRKAALHRTLTALEGKRLVKFEQRGRAFYWYKVSL